MTQTANATPGPAAEASDDVLPHAEPLPALNDHTAEALSATIDLAAQCWAMAEADSVVATMLDDADDVHLYDVWQWARAGELVQVLRRLHAAYPAPEGLADKVSYPSVELARAAYDAWHTAHNAAAPTAQAQTAIDAQEEAQGEAS